MIDKVEILNQDFISVPFKIVLSLIAVFALKNMANEVMNELEKTANDHYKRNM